MLKKVIGLLMMVIGAKILVVQLSVLYFTDTEQFGFYKGKARNIECSNSSIRSPFRSLSFEIAESGRVHKMVSSCQNIVSKLKTM
jgi:hypothetical protein